ncbi:hypothetical protein BDV38DRAFT_247016 [Aspergillus pseudotamarii]|uniref:Uncharacterized protein n=1 Tax=Aspergillus pseudotamarii TaxID=132259 RepID=A0A5N6SVZ7_ASPPS|nr:uncharacterized protein BDV38DRAFT_247016 [Aspergillus pseudotamarii]KAE8137284.1 hypothetical protein BDV38DRAFT_247016 [Aspergillus pseudotamarii]
MKMYKLLAVAFAGQVGLPTDVDPRARDLNPFPTLVLAMMEQRAGILVTRIMHLFALVHTLRTNEGNYRYISIAMQV